MRTIAAWLQKKVEPFAVFVGKRHAEAQPPVQGCYALRVGSRAERDAHTVKRRGLIRTPTDLFEMLRALYWAVALACEEAVWCNRQNTFVRNDAETHAVSSVSQCQ